MNLLERARNLAIERHNGQTISDGKPYIVHLEKVVSNVKKFGYGNDENLVIAAYLHDIVEDTETTIEEITALFGQDVASLVHGVTDEPGKNRKERKQNTYPKIKGNERITALKLCDRIANVEYNSGEDKERYLAMYQKEQSSFESGCKVDGVCDSLWNHLRSSLSQK